MQGPDVRSCGSTKSISHHLETMVEASCLLVFTGESSDTRVSWVVRNGFCPSIVGVLLLGWLGKESMALV